MSDKDTQKQDRISEERLKELSNVAYAAVLMNINGGQEDVFDMLIDQCPGNAVGHIGGALMMLRDQRFEEAITSLRENAVTAPINQANAEAVLLFSLYVAGRHDEAQEMAAKLAESHEENSPPRQMAKSLFQLDQALATPEQASMPSGISSSMGSTNMRATGTGGPFVPGMS